MAKYTRELDRLRVHTKMGRERFLQEVGDAFASLYPRKFQFFKDELAKLRQVSTSGYQAGKNGTMYCNMRVPTELWLFLKRWVPDFGDDSADVELMCRVWSDLVRVKRKDPRVRTRLFIDKEYRRAQSAEPAEHESAGVSHDSGEGLRA